MKKKVLISIMAVALFSIAIDFNNKNEAEARVEPDIVCQCEGNWFSGEECNSSSTPGNCAPSGTTKCWLYDGNC